MHLSTTENIAMSQKLTEELSERFLARLVKSVTGPMQVVSGPGLAAHDGRPGQKPTGDDAELLAKTQHVRKPQERLMEFIARTGLSPLQMRAMSKDEISRFVAIVSGHAQEAKPTGTFGQRAPQKFVLES